MAAARFNLYMHAKTDAVAQRGQAEKIRFMLADIGYKYTDIVVTDDVFETMGTDGTLVTGTLPMLEDTELDKTFEGSNTIMVSLAEIAHSEAMFRGSNRYLGVDPVKTGAGAEYATALSVEAHASDLAVSAEWVAKHFPQLEVFIKADDDENYRVNLDNTDYGYVTIFELINSLVEKNSSSILDDYRILSEFHESLAKTARFEKHITSRSPM